MCVREREILFRSSYAPATNQPTGTGTGSSQFSDLVEKDNIIILPLGDAKASFSTSFSVTQKNVVFFCSTIT